MNVLILNGPSLNMLGIREPGIYGTETYDSLKSRLQLYCDQKGVNVAFYQSNHEGALIDKIQDCYFGKGDAIVINPGAYAHTSIALRDAVSSVSIPVVEVHISDTEKREDFRKTDYLKDVCAKYIVGHGTDGYFEAIDYLLSPGGSEK